MAKTKSNSTQTSSQQDTRSQDLRRIAIVVSRYNESITTPLLAGALDVLATSGQATVCVFQCPGAFELPVLCMHAASSGRFDGIVALGCVVKGETTHDLHIASAVSHGLTHSMLMYGVPVAFGVLTVDTQAQAKARAGGRLGNKGAEAMSALFETLDALAAIENGEESYFAPEEGEVRPDKIVGRMGQNSSRSGKAKKGGKR